MTTPHPHAMSAVENIRAALAAGPTPGPWNQTALDTDMHDKSDYTYVRGMKLDACVFAGAAVTSPTKHVVLAPFDYNDSPDGMCSPNAAYIASVNPSAMAEVLAHIDAQQAEIERLKRGEYICQKCGLRKDADHPVTHDF